MQYCGYGWRGLRIQSITTVIIIAIEKSKATRYFYGQLLFGLKIVWVKYVGIFEACLWAPRSAFYKIWWRLIEFLLWQRYHGRPCLQCHWSFLSFLQNFLRTHWSLYLSEQNKWSSENFELIFSKLWWKQSTLIN